MAENGKDPLPTGPPNLCFNKDQFMNESFSVDKFVSECRKNVPLEKIREDLNIYLRVLRSAMIELINKDYADFVNLSTNLVGLDKAINNLVLPLGQLKEEVMSIKSVMDESKELTKKKLQARQQIREKKVCLQHLMNISLCIDKIEKLLGIHHNNETTEKAVTLSQRDLTSDVIERVATEFNQLHFYVTNQKSHVFVEKVKPRIIFITRILQDSLEKSFLMGIESKDLENLRRCLRIYATIDRMKDVEELFRHKIVQPYMEEIITEEFINSHQEGLKGMYDAILEFIPKHCSKLQEATRGTNSSEAIRGYDFVVNSVWPQVFADIEAKIPSLFAPGNPNAFHEKYMLTMDFLEKFEFACASQISVKRLRDHPSYTAFMHKWNLPVYFQIRFQDIAGKIETSLISPWELSSNDNEFSLSASVALWQSLHLCWSPDVYLPPLCHRFWKLTLQLVSRYIEWLKMIIYAELSVSISKEDSAEISGGGGGGAVVGETLKTNGLDNKSISNYKAISLASVVALVSDIELLNNKLLSFFEETIQKQLSTSGFQDMDILKESLKEFTDVMVDLTPQFVRFITEEVSSHCTSHLKLVNDIPRLYRKTNREVPNKPSAYVANTLKPLEMFLTDHKTVISDSTSKDWGFSILNNVTQQYFSVTSNVLTSVRKMEESLSRLKKARDKGHSTITGSNSGMTDDDKIRFQLYLDVENYGKQIEALGFDKSQVEQFPSLVELVESARNSPSRTS